jgi:HTH-type transcriptional regulator/antitoxin HigA
MNARLDAALAHWSYVAPLLTPASNETEYQSLVESLDTILDAGGANESHPLAALAAMVGELVAAWEREHVAMPEAMTVVEALAYFMARDDLRQSDLPEIGNQAKVSEVLSGKRQINLRQAKSLAARFGVPLELFVD